MYNFDDVKEPIENNRYFGALFLIPILLAFIFGGVWLKIVVSLMGIRAFYEYFQVVRVKKINPVESIGYLFAVIQFGLFFTGRVELKVISVLILIFTVVTLIITVFKRDYNFIDAAVTIMGFIYTIAFFSLIILIYEMPGGNFYVFTIFTISWLCDTSAYFTGRFFGKHKLIPEVSPKKTVEGAIGGLFGGALGTMVFGLILERTGQNLMSPIHFLIMGLIGSVFAQIGDLIASSFKRDCGVKDYPKLIPGHGGILDRFDSVLMAAVSVFLYLAIIFGQ
ncbi:MAG: phosphatidate cytidylyltransferase [Clostridiaceae bacterium]